MVSSIRSKAKIQQFCTATIKLYSQFVNIFGNRIMTRMRTYLAVPEVSCRYKAESVTLIDTPLPYLEDNSSGIRGCNINGVRFMGVDISVKCLNHHERSSVPLNLWGS